MLILRGLTVSDMDKFTFGMLINYCRAYDRVQSRGDFDEEAEEERRFEQLKSVRGIVEERFKNGEIGQKEYSDYLKSIEEA